MKRLVFDFERTWIENKRKEVGNPVRKIERLVAEKQLKLLKSAAFEIEVEVDDDGREAFIDSVADFISETFGENDVWSIMTVNGDVADLKDFIVKRKSGEEVPEKKEETPVGSQPEEPEEIPVAPQLEEVEEQPEVVVEPEKTVEEAKSEVAMFAAPKTVEEHLVDVVEQICEGPVVKNAPAMAEYIRELGKIMPMLSNMHMKDCIWSRNLLVSMDDGFGYSEFLREIANVLDAYEFIERSNRDNWVQENVIKKGSNEEQRYVDWEKALSYAKAFCEGNKGKPKRVILSLDIREWQSELNTEKVKKYVKEICEYSENFLCVFRIPHAETSVLTRTCDILADVTSIRALSIPDISMQSMVDYIKNRLVKLNCTCDGSCDEHIEQWIMKEKSDDSFYGYKTLDKMVNELVYRKALFNVESGVVSHHFTEADMMRIFETDAKADDAYEVLNKLIGMVTVKQSIAEIVTQIKVQKDLANQGKKIDRPCIHMMFTGGPGTGKTTVARILARILKQEGVLRKGLFYEVHGRSLCGRYVGETSPRTSAICRDAYGSVLFIDEAYSLMSGSNDRDYGREAIQTLLTEMENHRDDFCVILAGYTKQMHEMMNENTGLKGRIPFEIEFPNYSREELEQIFYSLLDGKFEYEEELREAVKVFFESIPDHVLESEEFSNGRMVRNMFERVWGKAAYRTKIEGVSDIILTKEDFEAASRMIDFQNLVEEKGKKKIGFSCV